MVTVGGGLQLRITFTAQLARPWSIHKRKYAAVAPYPDEGRVEFRISDEPLRHGHGYCLGFNGGASKKKNSPSRTISVPAEAVPMLALGRYLPRVENKGDVLIVSVFPSGPAGPA